jgi:hypothetical protein
MRSLFLLTLATSSLGLAWALNVDTGIGAGTGEDLAARSRSYNATCQAIAKSVSRSSGVYYNGGVFQ